MSEADNLTARPMLKEIIELRRRITKRRDQTQPGISSYRQGVIEGLEIALEEFNAVWGDDEVEHLDTIIRALREDAK